MRLKEIHPLIHGLVRVLPVPGTPMLGDRHQDWLDCAASILALLYPEPDDGTGSQATETAARAATGGDDDTALSTAKTAPNYSNPIPLMAEDQSTAARKDRAEWGAGTEEGQRSGYQSPPVDAPIPPTTAAQTVPVVSDDPVAGSSQAGGDPVETPAPHSPEAAPEIAADRARKPSLDGAEPVRQVDGDRAGEAARAPASPAADHTEALAGTNGNAGKSGGPSGSSAPTLIDLVRAVYREHPDWTARQIATHLDRPINSVTTYLTQVRHEAKRAEQAAQNAPRPFAAPEASEQPEPENARQQSPAATREASSSNSLRDKVATMVRFYPNWTARMIAQRLGYPLASVQGHYDDARAQVLAAAPLPDPDERVGA